MSTLFLDDEFVYRESDREYLSQQLLGTLVIVLLVIGWVWGVLLIAVGKPVASWFYWSAPLSLLLGGFSSYRLLERHPRWAAALSLGALWVSASATAYASGNQVFLFSLSFVIVLAGVLSRRWLILFFTGLSLGYVWLVYRLGKLAGGSWAAPLLFLVASFGLSWLLWHYLDIALEWSWHNHQRAVRSMLEARQRRAELARLTKALDEENDRLIRLNRELIEARREAEEARRLKAEFAANVSHELRTPINLIVGFSEMMYTSPESYGGQLLPPEYLGDIHAIYRSAKHLQSLIDDILDLSRIDAKHMALTREWVDIGEVITEAVAAIRELVERKGLELQVEIEPDLPRLYLDRTRIRQVLLNLIANAVRFTENGYIRVTCRDHLAQDWASQGGSQASSSSLSGPSLVPTSRYVRVSVLDSGIGIRPEDIEGIFEEFRQADGSLRRKYGGTGLGLAISKRFVELHGGWMWAESELGKGSTFHFVLPTEDGVVSHVELKGTRPLKLTQLPEKTVIVLDDDPNIIQLFRRYTRNCRIEGAATMQQAAQMVVDLQPALVVSSKETPITDVNALTETHPSLKSARLTLMSCPISSPRRKVLALGVRDYLVKPVSKEELVGAMERLQVPLNTILAVEDDPNMMRLFERMLAGLENPVQLKKAYNAEDAQEIMRSLVPDLVLLDFALPGMDGHELLSWMQRDARLRKVPVIAVTATTYWEEAWPIEVPEVTLARRAGFSMSEILSLVEEVAAKFPSRYAAVTERPSS